MRRHSLSSFFHEIHKCPTLVKAVCSNLDKYLVFAFFLVDLYSSIHLKMKSIPNAQYGNSEHGGREFSGTLREQDKSTTILAQN